MADPNDATIPTPLSNGTVDQPGGSQAAPPVPAGFSDTPVSAAPATPAVPAGFSDTPIQDQSFWNKITHGGEASAPGQAEQFEQYKKDKWKSIINHVESGNLHGAAGEFLNLFQNPYGGGTAGEFATGALKSAGQTANTVSDVISHVLPKVVRPEDVQRLKGIETLKGAGEQTGAGLETLAEFMMGDEALKGLEGLTRTEKLAKLMPHMKMLENSPKLMKATKALYNISKMSGLTAGEAALHPEEGQTRGEAAQAGAIGGAVFGTGAEALSAGASSIPLIKNAIESTLRPTTETVGSTEVPVRNPSILARQVQKAVPDTMRQFAQEQTGPAVAKGIGQVAQEAAGTEGVVSPNQYDRMGIRAEADKAGAKSKATFQALDKVSGNMLSEAQQMAEDASDDYSSAGRKEYRQAMDLQDAIFENYKNHSELQGMDLDQAKADWRKQMALREISKKLTGATESSETGNLDYQFKQGKQLSEAVDSLVKNDKDVLQRAGFTDDHIDQLQKFGRIIREQGQTPKFSGYMGAIAKTLAGAIGFHSGGWAGAMGGTAAEIAGEHAGGWLADRMLGKVLTTPAALPILTEGFSKNIDPAIVTNQLKAAIATADPSWAAKTGDALSNLWHDESGNLKIPGTGTQTVGTAEGAKAESGPTMNYEHDQTGKFGNLHHMVTTTQNGAKIGELAAQDTAPGVATIRSNQIYDEANRGKGYGKAQLMHLLTNAIDSDVKTVNSDISTTGAAQNVWTALEKRFPDAVTKKVYADGRPQWSVNLKALKDRMDFEGGSLTAQNNADTSRTPRLAADIGQWQAPPELGAFSDQADIGAKARAQAERRTGGALKRGEVERRAEANRRSPERIAQAEEDQRFGQARRELGENATFEQIKARADDLRSELVKSAAAK